MQSWYTNIVNFHDDFMFLIDWCHFYTEIGKFPMILWLEQDKQLLLGRYFPFSRLGSTNSCGKLSLARNNKNLKVTKNQLTQKFHDSNDK